MSNKFRRVPLPMRYPGSKTFVISKLCRFLPRHQHFVSVFGGSGAEILKKPRSPLETFNDKNKDVVNAFRVVRDEKTRRRLVRLLEMTPHSRRDFEDAVEMLRKETDPVLRAWALLVVANQARAGNDPLTTLPSAWGYQKKRNRRDRWPLLPKFVEQVGERFREVQIENLNWEEIFRRYDARGTLFFCDPPYPLWTRKEGLYFHEMTQTDHVRLLKAVRQLRGFVVLCTYDNALYNEMLGDWHQMSFKTVCSISPASQKPARTEVVFLNFNPNEFQKEDFQWS